MSATLNFHSILSAKARGALRRPGLRFMGWIVANCVALNAAVYLLASWMNRRGWLPDWLSDTNFSELGRFFRLKQGHDSWGPMLSALHYWLSHPGSAVYQDVFFAQHTKFQYPLTSLLPFLLLHRLDLSDRQINFVGGATGWISLCLVALVCIAIARRSAAPPRMPPLRLGFTTAFSVFLGSLLFYPLLKGCVSGQIQTSLTLIYSMAFYCWLRGKESAGGVLIGLMVLIKPQLSLLLLWAALRKRWSAFGAGLASIALLLPIAVFVFGWRNNLDYLLVLRAIGRVGESHSQNQSMNGLLNRLLFNGGDQMFHQDHFPPFHPVVYAGTLLIAALLVGLALVYPLGRKHRGGMADFACMTAVATIASPIAWEHHYGVFLPILVWLWFVRSSGRAPLRNAAWLAVAYVLMSDCFSPVNILYRVPVFNVLQSYTYFAGLMIIWILLSHRYSPIVVGQQESENSGDLVPAL